MNMSSEPQPHPMMCEAKGCDRVAAFDCEQIPGTELPGWEGEPTARCEQHSKGLLILGRVTHDRRDPGGKSSL